jgi:ketosteroid isomerase-like protein
MSKQNVELHRRAIETYNARDVEAWIALSDPQIEFHSAFSEVGGAVYRGHDGLRKLFKDIDEVWGNEIRIDPESFYDLGEHTLVFQVSHARGKQSGVEVAMPVAVVARWRDGLCVYSRGYSNKGEALRDLGVAEDELEPVAP